jgi:hypothetical protein
MKKDIDFSPVTGVELVIAKTEKEGAEDSWNIYIINKNLIELENVMITSKGYGEIDGKSKKTSTLRHMIQRLEQESFALVEPIDPAVFQLTNEYWVSYYILDQIFDKKFIFVPETIKEENLVMIEELGLKGIRHA